MQTRVDSELTREFRKQATAALTKVSKTLGIDVVKMGNIAYDKDSFNCTLSCKVLPMNESGTKMSEEQANWNKYCRGYDLTEADWNRTVNISGSTFKLISIKAKKKRTTQKRQLSFIIKDLNDGEIRRTTAAAVHEGLRKRKVAVEDAKSKMEPAHKKLKGDPENLLDDAKKILTGPLNPEAIQKLLSLASMMKGNDEPKTPQVSPAPALTAMDIFSSESKPNGILSSKGNMPNSKCVCKELTIPLSTSAGRQRCSVCYCFK